MRYIVGKVQTDKSLKRFELGYIIKGRKIELNPKNKSRVRLNNTLAIFLRVDSRYNELSQIRHLKTLSI
jgi:hypothetical protein